MVSIFNFLSIYKPCVLSSHISSSLNYISFLQYLFISIGSISNEFIDIEFWCEMSLFSLYPDTIFIFLTLWSFILTLWPWLCDPFSWLKDPDAIIFFPESIIPYPDSMIFYHDSMILYPDSDPDFMLLCDVLKSLGSVWKSPFLFGAIHKYHMITKIVFTSCFKFYF